MKKYIHIGYPKNFSTSLQRDYFSNHPDLFHLGIGLRDNLGYYDSTVEKTFEVYLKTCKSLKYNLIRGDLIHHFEGLFEKAKKTDCKAIGVSSEHLSFAFTHDSLSAEEKAVRLKEIFGDNTTILLIVRNQFDLIKSIYRESVRVGFIGGFNEYIDLIYKYQDRNFIFDFRFDLVYTLYKDLFGSDNVKMLFFENYRNDSGALNDSGNQFLLLKDLDTALGIESHNLEFNHFNKAIPSNKIIVKSKQNSLRRHDLGNQLLESAEKHRIKTYLEEDLKFFELEEKTYSDVLSKRKNIEEVIKSKENIELSYEADDTIISSLKAFYEKGNIELESMLNISLPEKYLSLKF